MKRLLQAAHFAAEKHAGQRRKNAAATPYINHPLEVAHILSEVGGVIDEEILLAAILHDTVEDTDTSLQELALIFGDRVAEIVAECTDDKSLEKQVRKQLQIEHAPHKSPAAKQIKIADKISNLKSVLHDPPKDWSMERRRGYFQWAEKVVARLTGINPALDRCVGEILAEGKRFFGDGPVEMAE